MAWHRPEVDSVLRFVVTRVELVRSGETAAFCARLTSEEGGLQTLQPTYPAVWASLTDAKTRLLLGLILCAHWHEGKWYLSERLLPQYSAWPNRQETRMKTTVAETL